MTVDVTERDGVVIVLYRASDGAEATATVIGEPLKSVQGRVEQIVDGHDLVSKAESRQN